jgi:transposase
MPRYAPNRMPKDVKRQYFELIRSGVRGSVAAREVGVSLSCGSVWFIEAGRVHVIERPISRRYFNQDDRIEIAEGLAVGDSVKVIAARIGKSYQSVYREIARNRKVDGSYHPWYAHNQAHLRRNRPKRRRFVIDDELRDTVAAQLDRRWSPAQISRWLRRRYPRRPGWHVCAETIRRRLPGAPPGGEPAPLSAAAHGPDLPSAPWSGPIPRWRPQAVHCDEVHPRPTCRSRVPPRDRPLGRRLCDVESRTW